MNETIQLKRDGHVAVITLNCPERMNALDYESWIVLDKTLRTLSADDDIRFVVLQGAGGKAFSAGADIAEFPTRRLNTEQARAYGKVTTSAMDALAECRHPTVALITGVCVGGGLELASLCDLRYSNASGRFGVPVNKLGLVMSYGELGGLLRLVGPATAAEIVLEGRVFKAPEALEKGLINRIYPDESVVEDVMKLVGELSERAPLVNRWHKKFIRRLLENTPLSEDEWLESYDCFDTEDFRIGYQAFLNKQTPRFVGR